MVGDMLRFCAQVCMPYNDDLRGKILIKAYSSFYTTHPRSVKMYQALRRSFWWFGMKKNVANFMVKCLVC